MPLVRQRHGAHKAGQAGNLHPCCKQVAATLQKFQLSRTAHVIRWSVSEKPARRTRAAWCSSCVSLSS